MKNATTLEWTDIKKQLSTGLTSALMACTGGAILVVQSAQHFNLSEAQLISWLFVCYAGAGLFNLLLAYFLKLPIAGAHSITGIAFLSTTPIILSYNMLIGTFLLAGLFIFVLGVSGLFEKLFRYIPRPVIEAMLAGIVIQFVIKMIPIFEQEALVALLALGGYLLSVLKYKGIPPMIFVLAFSTIGLLLTTSFGEPATFSFSLPELAIPHFSWFSTISIALPIAILVLSNDLAVAMAALKKNEYQPPINRILALSGAASVIGGMFGAHSVNAGGMMTTLCSSEESGKKQLRYRAGLISSIGCILFGVLAYLIVPYLVLLPAYFITLIVGFSLLGIAVNSLKNAFSESGYLFSVVFAFIISTANISFFSISSALWSLVIGTITALVFKEGIYKKKELKQDEASTS